MGIGPSVAIPAAAKSAGLELGDIDLFEINVVKGFPNSIAALGITFKPSNLIGHFQAFASQYVYCPKKLELDPEEVNVNGGAIALEHPLGATGTFSLMYYSNLQYPIL